jgi:hypothetical protein
MYVFLLLRLFCCLNEVEMRLLRRDGTNAATPRPPKP